MRNLWITVVVVLLILCASALGQNTPVAYKLQERNIVAMTILGEARGEGQAGMYAVACVIAQRSVAWNKTPIQVCLQRKQFSCWNAGYAVSYQHLVRFLDTPQGNYAKRLAENLTRLNRRYVNFADHYCTLQTNNYWTRNAKVIAIIGNHKFYKLR